MSTIAERYAAALYELGNETGELVQLTEQVTAMARAYASSPELRSVLHNPLVEEQQRDAILSVVALRMRLSRVVLNTVRLLAERRRLGTLPEIARALVQRADQQAGLLRATVTSAVPLSESYCSRLMNALEQATQRKIVLERREDPSLIGGLVTRIGDRTIDASIRGRLQELERHLLNQVAAPGTRDS